MAYRDLRQFLEKLKEEGELNEVAAQVDWDLEIGGISPAGHRAKCAGAPF